MYSEYTSFLKICAPAISKGGTARGWGLRTVIDSAKKKAGNPAINTPSVCAAARVGAWIENLTPAGCGPA